MTRNRALALVGVGAAIACVGVALVAVPAAVVLAGASLVGVGLLADYRR